MDLIRFIQVYIIQGMVCACFFFIVYKVLKRDTKRLNLVFSGFYICAGIGVFINFIYAPLTDELIVLILNFLTNYIITFGGIFLLVFTLILLRSEKILNTKKQLTIILTYGAILFGMVFFLPFGGVTINESTGWRPVWSLFFLAYVLAVSCVMAIVPTIYYSLKVYNKFEDITLKKRWKYYIIGTCGFFFITIGTFISNTINRDEIRLLWGIISLSVFLWAYLLYYGVGRQIK